MIRSITQVNRMYKEFISTPDNFYPINVEEAKRLMKDDKVLIAVPSKDSKQCIIFWYCEWTGTFDGVGFLDAKLNMALDVTNITKQDMSRIKAHHHVQVMSQDGWWKLFQSGGSRISHWYVYDFNTYITNTNLEINS